MTLKPGVEPRGLVRALTVSPRYVYTEAVLGFAADLTTGQLQVLQARPEVESIEEDQVVTADAQVVPEVQAYQVTSSASGLYGLDRIDQRTLPLSGSYSYTATAANVTAY